MKHDNENVRLACAAKFLAILEDWPARGSRQRAHSVERMIAQWGSLRSRFHHRFEIPTPTGRHRRVRPAPPGFSQRRWTTRERSSPMRQCLIVVLLAEHYVRPGWGTFLHSGHVEVVSGHAQLLELVRSIAEAIGVPLYVQLSPAANPCFGG